MKKTTHKKTSRPETVVLPVKILRDFLNGLDALERDIDRSQKRIDRLDAAVSRLKAQHA